MKGVLGLLSLRNPYLFALIDISPPQKGARHGPVVRGQDGPRRGERVAAVPRWTRIELKRQYLFSLFPRSPLGA
jgi:hypothetical protein